MKLRIVTLRIANLPPNGRCAKNGHTAGIRIIRHSKFAFAPAAFTLIEVMIAIAIFSLVMAAIYSTWDLILRASRVSQSGGGAGAARARRHPHH